MFHPPINIEPTAGMTEVNGGETGSGYSSTQRLRPSFFCSIPQISCQTTLVFMFPHYPDVYRDAAVPHTIMGKPETKGRAVFETGFSSITSLNYLPP
jgi:hypothetical protein